LSACSSAIATSTAPACPDSSTSNHRGPNLPPFAAQFPENPTQFISLSGWRLRRKMAEKCGGCVQEIANLRHPVR
jgi:hypothetical protein